MSVRLGSNIASLNAQRKLAENTSHLSTVLERLSSGQRINRASDDAAGLAVASSLNAESRIFTQGIRNLNDGISMLAIAEGAVRELSAILVRGKELAIQSANGSFSFTQRRALGAELNALTDEYNRIIRSTEFNGIAVLASPDKDNWIQAGIGESAALLLNIGDELARTVGDGTFGAATTHVVGNVSDIFASDVNNDGNLDMVFHGFTAGEFYVTLGNGDGTFKATVSYATSGGSVGQATMIDINNDGNLDYVGAGGVANGVTLILGNGDGTFKSPTVLAIGNFTRSADVADVNNDGHLDIVAGNNLGAVLKINVFLGNGDGTFKSAITQGMDSQSSVFFLRDINRDGNQDLVRFANSVAPTPEIQILLGDGTGKFNDAGSIALPDAAVNGVVEDFDGDGFYDIAAMVQDAGAYGELQIFHGRGDGSFSEGAKYEAGTVNNDIVGRDINGDGLIDLISSDSTSDQSLVFIGRGDGTFSEAATYAIGRSVDAGDFDGDGVPDLVSSMVGVGGFVLRSGNSTLTAEMQRLSIYTAEESRSALDALRETFERMSAEIGAIGGTQARLTYAAQTLATMRDNYLNASERIMNADIAHESAKLVRGQILQQVASAILAQANQQSAIVLQLLSEA